VAELIRAGIAQMDAREFDREYNLSQAEMLVRSAAEGGAQIVCTPEASIQGYPRVALPEGKQADDSESNYDSGEVIWYPIHS
jgi:predicted amidohydrolase